MGNRDLAGQLYRISLSFGEQGLVEKKNIIAALALAFWHLGLQ